MPAHVRLSLVGRLFLVAFAAMSWLAFEATVATPQAAAETRTLRMYFTHTKESATITFKKNGRYVKSGLKKANRFLRDWRRKEPTRMDPQLLDLVWEVYKKSGSRKPIHVISGYRSPKTNKMLRRRGRNVAKTSQHTLGKALDFFMPDVKVTKLRALGLKAHRGGVGYYRGSFVHLDTGRVRHWPRMSAKQLARVFPRGKTIHVPSNGRKMKGYKTAMANLSKGRNADGSRRNTSVRKSLLARLFSRSGTDDTEGDEDIVAPAPRKRTPAAKPAPVRVAKVTPKPKPLPKAQKGPNLFAQEAAAAAKVAEARAAAAKAAADKANTQDDARRVAELTAAAEKAADAAKAARLASEAEEATRLAAVVPARLTVPSRRPPASIPALQPTVVVESITKPAAGALVAEAGLPVPGSGADDVANLASDVTTALAPTPTATSPTDLALAVPSAPAPPALPVVRPPADIPSVAAAPVNVAGATVPTPSSPVGTSPAVADAPVEVARLEPVAPAPDVDALRAEVASTLAERVAPAAAPVGTVPAKSPVNGAAANAIVPTSRSVADATARRQAELAAALARVPVPTNAARKLLTAPKVDAASRIARTDDTTLVTVPGTASMRAALSIGDLSARKVKAWAVASNTRSGPSARLRAPNYAKSLLDGAPSRVYRAGFAASRSPLRADGFRGTAFTRVALADLSQRD